MSPRTPNFNYERDLLSAGYGAIVGVDEAGAGALAGPIVAAAVILPLNSRIGDLDDSKTKTPMTRERLYNKVCERAVSFAIAEASVEEINKLGIRPANYLAMQRAVERVPQADFALIDAWTVPELLIPQRGIIKGDRLVKSIAAASILAKVSRDRTMQELSEQFPEYELHKHKGYGTKLHRELIQKHGPAACHRISWSIFQQLSK